MHIERHDMIIYYNYVLLFLTNYHDFMFFWRRSDTTLSLIHTDSNCFYRNQDYYFFPSDVNS